MHFTDVGQCDIQYIFYAGCTNARCQLTVVTKFSSVMPYTLGFSICHLLHVTLLVLRIFRWLIDLWKIVHPCFIYSFIKIGISPVFTWLVVIISTYY
jgi:hypothetical protein